MHFSDVETVTVLKVLKTPLRLPDLQEGLTELKQAAVFTTIVNYSKMIQIKIRKKKAHRTELSGAKALVPSCPLSVVIWKVFHSHNNNV